MNPTTDRIDVAAGIAVQSRYYSFWDSHEFAWAGVESFGIAQVTDRQMKEYELEGYDQDDPNIAIRAMTERIDRVLGECKGCTAVDKLIAASLAQNGSGFPKGEMKNVINNYMENGTIGWNQYFDDRAKTATDSIFNNIRATGHQTYDTRFMVSLYTNDLLELEQRGWKLPYGLTTSQIHQVQKDYTYK